MCVNLIKFDLSLDLLINFPLPVGSENAMCNVCPDSFTYLAPFENVCILRIQYHTLTLLHNDNDKI